MGKTKTAKKASKPAPKPAAKAPVTPPVAGSQAAYQKYLPAAMALDAASVVPFRGDASLAYHNVSTGVASLVAQKARAQALPGTDVTAILELPEQCLALVFAVEQALQAAGSSTGQIAPVMAQGFALRSKLFAAADALVAAGLLPAQKVATLHAGKGKLDAAQDLVGLAALLSSNAAAIKGKTAITSADTAQAAQLGSQLLTMLKPTRAKKARPASVVDAADTRDRMWTLVQDSYANLWKACAYLYGQDQIDARVPPLQSRTATTSLRKKANAAKKAAAAKAAAPAAS
jgi:hypothetical protein